MAKFFDVARDMMTQHVWEKIRGETYWLPTDPHEIASIPKHQIRKGLHDVHDGQGPLSIRKALYAGETSPVFHVCFRWQEPKSDVDKHKSASPDTVSKLRESLSNKRQRGKDLVSVTYKVGGSPETDSTPKSEARNAVTTPGSEVPKALEIPSPPPLVTPSSSVEEVPEYIHIDRSDGAITELSLYRSKDLQDVKDVYQTCLACKQLFILLDSVKELKRLMEKMRAHPLWHAVHIAARMGTLSYFSRFKTGDPKLIKLLNTACQPEGAFPLHIAVEHNYSELVRLLLKLGGKASQVDVGNDANALHYAASASSAMVELLCETEDGKSVINALNKEGYTPVFVAIRMGNPLVTHAFVRNGAELNIRCKGRSPLFQCLQDTNGPRARQVIAAMVEDMPEMVEESDPLTGNTGLHAAAGKQALGALLVHVSNRGFVNKKNLSGQTAIHMHAARNDVGAVMTLASYGADLDATDASRNTALHFAASKGNLTMVRMLLVLGANPNTLNANKDTPRHLASKLIASEKSKKSEQQERTGDLGVCGEWEWLRTDIVKSLDLMGASRCTLGKVGCRSLCADRRSLGLDGSGASTPAISLEDVSAPTLPIPGPLKDLKDWKQKACIARLKKAKKPQHLLSLDGGGIRGLIVVQVLLALERKLGQPLWPFFDWTAGTSTGSFIACALALGKTLRECQYLYLRFKDQLFEGWARPYNTANLEALLKREMGADTVLGDITRPKYHHSFQAFEGWARPYNTANLEALLKREMGADTVLGDITRPKYHHSFQAFEGWARPYNTANLEALLKREMGADTVLGDITRPKYHHSFQAFEGWARPYNTANLEALLKREMGADTVLGDITRPKYHHSFQAFEGWARPYNTANLEALLKREMGADTVLGDITRPKYHHSFQAFEGWARPYNTANLEALLKREMGADTVLGDITRPKYHHSFQAFEGWARPYNTANLEALLKREMGADTVLGDITRPKYHHSFQAFEGWARPYNTANLEALLKREMGADTVLGDITRPKYHHSFQAFEGWARPYNTANLEALLKREMGADTVLGDITRPKMLITTTRADKHPMRLELFRNYQIPVFSEEENAEAGYVDPKSIKMWRAMRCSSAAPTYFASVDSTYLDGGLVANNPTMELIAEILNWNNAIQYKESPEPEVEMGLILSIGTGQIPEVGMPNIDVEIGTNPVQAFSTMRNLGVMMVEQLTAAEGSPVDRSRTLAHALGLPYFRFSAPMTHDLPLDTRDDNELVHSFSLVGLMWDAEVYVRNIDAELTLLARLLRDTRL